jgi:hypothetical protein
LPPERRAQAAPSHLLPVSGAPCAILTAITVRPCVCVCACVCICVPPPPQEAVAREGAAERLAEVGRRMLSEEAMRCSLDIVRVCTSVCVCVCVCVCLACARAPTHRHPQQQNHTRGFCLGTLVHTPPKPPRSSTSYP